MAVTSDPLVMRIEDNVFARNEAKQGGSLRHVGEASAILVRNEFRNNVATDAGGAIWISNEFVLNDPKDNTYTGNRPNDVYIQPE